MSASDSSPHLMPARADHYESGLAEILSALWRGKYAIAAGAAIGFIVAFIFLMVSVPHYRAEILIAPPHKAMSADIRPTTSGTQRFSQANAMNTMTQFDAPDFMRYQQMIKGPRVASILFEDQELMKSVGARRIFAFSAQSNAGESVESLTLYMRDHVAVEPVGETPMRRVVLSHPDRAFALRFLSEIHRITDTLIKQEMAAQTQARIVHLTTTLSTPQLHPDQRRALTALLMEQEHIRMMVEMDQSFAALMVEPPFAALTPSWPHHGLVYACFILAGIFLAFSLFMSLVMSRATPKS